MGCTEKQTSVRLDTMHIVCDLVQPGSQAALMSCKIIVHGSVQTEFIAFLLTSSAILLPCRSDGLNDANGTSVANTNEPVKGHLRI